MSERIYTAKNGAQYVKDSRGRVRFISGASPSYMKKIASKPRKRKESKVTKKLINEVSSRIKTGEFMKVKRGGSMMIDVPKIKRALALQGMRGAGFWGSLWRGIKKTFNGDYLKQGWDTIGNAIGIGNIGSKVGSALTGAATAINPLAGAVVGQVTGSNNGLLDMAKKKVGLGIRLNARRGRGTTVNPLRVGGAVRRRRRHLNY